MVQFNGKLTSENGKLKVPAGSSIGRQSLLRRSFGASREAVALYLSVSRTRRFIRRRVTRRRGPGQRLLFPGFLVSE